MRIRDIIDQWERGITFIFRQKKSFMEHMLSHKSHWWKLEHQLLNQLNLVLNCLHQLNQDRGSTQDLSDIITGQNRVCWTGPKFGAEGGGSGMAWYRILYLNPDFGEFSGPLNGHVPISGPWPKTDLMLSINFRTISG